MAETIVARQPVPLTPTERALAERKRLADAVQAAAPAPGPVALEPKKKIRAW